MFGLGGQEILMLLLCGGLPADRERDDGRDDRQRDPSAEDDDF